MAEDKNPLGARPPRAKRDQRVCSRKKPVTAGASVQIDISSINRRLLKRQAEQMLDVIRKNTKKGRGMADHEAV